MRVCGVLQVLARETVATCLHARTGVRHRRSSRGSERTGLFVLECLQWIEVGGAARGEYAGGHAGEERAITTIETRVDQGIAEG